MDGHSGGRVRAATAPERPETGAEQKQEHEKSPVASASESAGRPQQPVPAVSASRPPMSGQPRERPVSAAPRAASTVAPSEATEPVRRRPAATETPEAGSTGPAAGDAAPEPSGPVEGQQQAPTTDDASQPANSPVEICLLGLCVG
ncbi:hypothetical protein ACFW9D_27980 [Streptomyces sp. NPDC059524]|uniref:hypothetical protein n=1 Tax=Streptomyces sp. NPDC059524 TaxID=3346856 RepID=UPI00367B4FC9